MRFDIAQIQNPVALHKAKENLRNQLAVANVPSDVIDQLLTQYIWKIAIEPPSPSISGYEKDDYDEKRRAARKAFGAVDAQVGQICKRIMDHCMSERMLSAIKMHKEFHNEVRSESLQGNIAKLVSVIFELVKKTEGNPASVIAMSLFTDKMLDDNLSTFVYDKQITYDAYRSLKPTTAKQKINEFETIVVSAILDCHILTQAQHPICCEVEEILQLNTVSRPTTFAELLDLIQQANFNNSAGTSRYAVRQKQGTPITIAAATMAAKSQETTPPAPPPPSKIDYSQACNKASRIASKTPALLLDLATPIICDRPGCRYNHDTGTIKNAIDKVVADGKKLEKALAAVAVTKHDTKGYSQSSYAYSTIPCTGQIRVDSIPHIGQVTMVGSAPAAAHLTPWFPPNTILLDEGSQIHCANDTLIDVETIAATPPKYVGTIGGWVKTDHEGIMLITGLRCDHTPLAPFNIISKGLITQDPHWTLTEGSYDNKRCYMLTHHNGFTMSFIDHGGVFMHLIPVTLPVPPQRHQPVTASTIAMPQQYIDNIAQLTFSSAEKHGLLRIYPLLESGLSYAEIQDLVRTKHLTNIGLLDIANAKLVLGYDKAWLAGNNKLNQLSTPIPPIPAHVRLEEITVTFDVGYLFKHNFLIGVGAHICDAQLLNATNAKVTRENITQMLNHFSRAGYKVVAYSADSGSEFAQDLNRTLALCGIRQDPAYGGEHAATAEKMIQLLKYKLRSLIIRHGRRIQKTNTYEIRHDLIRHAVAYVVQQYLMTVRKGKTTSTSEAITGIMPSYDDYSLPFLTVVEISDTSNLTQRNNTNLALTNTCLSLAPLADGRGGYSFYNLNTKRIINRARNQYTVLTRMDEHTYHQYLDYINDKNAITPWNLDQLDSDVDEHDMGSTVLTRAVRYQPVHEVLNSREPLNQGVAPTVVTNNTVPEQGVDTTTAEPLNQGVAPTVVTNNTVPEQGVDTTTAEVTGTVPSLGHTQEAGVDQPTTRTTTRKSNRQKRQTITGATIAPHPPTPTGLFAIACATIFTAARLVSEVSDTIGIAGATIRAQSANDADYQELHTICTMGTFIPRFYRDIDNDGKIVGSTMLRTQKHDLVTGKLLGYKSRFIALGNQYHYNYESLETSSPTPRYEHIVSLLLNCHKQGYTIKTGDVKNAYLQASLPPQSHYIRVDSKHADTLCRINPTWAAYRNHKGHMYCEVSRALYGFEASGFLWHQKVTDTLLQLGCTRNPLEPCIFKYQDTKSNDTVYITVYVDDFLFAGSNDKTIKYITDGLTIAFGDIKLEEGPRLSYLNVLIDTTNPQELTLSMSQYKRDIVDGIELEANVTTPCNHHTFDHVPDSSPRLSKAEHEFFHKKTAQILYLSNHLHGELCYYANKLCQRVHAPTIDDLKKLYHLLAYIKHHQDEILTLDASHFNAPKIYIDASYATNADLKSQSGLILYFGRGSFICRSHKQKINVKSSTEAEIVALSDMASVALGYSIFNGV